MEQAIGFFYEELKIEIYPVEIKSWNSGESFAIASISLDIFTLWWLVCLKTSKSALKNQNTLCSIRDAYNVSLI